MLRVLVASSAAAMALFLIACGGDGAAAVKVTLQEWSIAAEPVQVRPGGLRLSVRNGGQHEHELLVIKSDLPPGELPLSSSGRVDEDKVNITARLPALAAGGEAELTFVASPGKYLLICNRGEPAAAEPAAGHYRNGMVTPLLALEDR